MNEVGQEVLNERSEFRNLTLLDTILKWVTYP